jgi:hypothetical protein
MLQRDAKGENIGRAAVQTLLRGGRPAMCEHEWVFWVRANRINQNSMPCSASADCFGLTALYTPKGQEKSIKRIHCSDRDQSANSSFWSKLFGLQRENSYSSATQSTCKRHAWWESILSSP